MSNIDNSFRGYHAAQLTNESSGCVCVDDDYDNYAAPSLSSEAMTALNAARSVAPSLSLEAMAVLNAARLVAVPKYRSVVQKNADPAILNRVLLKDEHEHELKKEIINTYGRDFLNSLSKEAEDRIVQDVQSNMTNILYWGDSKLIRASLERYIFRAIDKEYPQA